MLDLSQIDAGWTLFLDRDGVINEEKYMDYVYNFEEFRFLKGVKDAIQKLARIFTRIVLVTNQRGVGRGLMTEQALLEIQKQMVEEIIAAGGRIDKIYYCTSNDNCHPNRKPNPGMAYLAKKELPSIDFERSIMVGNSLSDMEFGRNAGMHTVHLRTTHPDIASPHPLIDLSYADLPDFTENLRKALHLQ